MKTLLTFTGLIAVLFLSASSNVEAQRRRVIKTKPAKASADSVAELTAEGYRDLIVKTADTVYMLESTVIKGMQALQSTPVCVVTLDTEKQKLAAQSAANHRKAWARARVPKALAASHKDILSWIESAESQFKTAPACMYGGSLPLLQFFGTFGAYDDIRKNAASALTSMDITLPPIEKPPIEKK
jgi:hypothetical protein